MLSLVLTLALSKAVAPTPPPLPPPAVKSSARSASLIQAEIAELEAQLGEVKPLKAWIPMVIGAGAAAACGITAFVLLFSSLSAPALIVAALVLVVVAVVSGIVGVSIGIGMQFANASRSAKTGELRGRLILLREELRRTNASLAPWSDGLATLVPVFTF